MADRITVQEAARRLGIKDDAIRKRIQRGSLDHDKDPDGRVFVYLDETHDTSEDTYKDTTRYPSSDRTRRTSHDATYDSSYADLVEVLRSELEDWKQVVATRDEELRRKDHIIAALTERIPELEPPREESSDPPRTSDTASEGVANGRPSQGQQESSERRSWLYRFFFGPE
jgi:excisionase family DNA binding protein